MPVTRLDAPIFIVGPGRSGTTLVRSLLSAHSRIAMPPETHFMKLAERHGALYHAPRDFAAFWQELTESNRFRNVGIDAARCRARLNGQQSAQAVFASILATYAECCDKPRAGEKTPGHVNYLPTLLDWFPDARVIVMRRDPRAVVASQLKTPWAQSQMTPRSLRDGIFVKSRVAQVAAYAEDWRRIHEDIAPIHDGDARVTVLGYEDLVRDPEGELRKLCAFLDEAFEPAMLTDRSRDTVPQPAATHEMSDTWREWSNSHNARTFEPVSNDSLDVWRGELSARDVALIEDRCANGMAAAGYARIQSLLRRRTGRLGLRVFDAAGRAETGLRRAIGQRL